MDKDISLEFLKRMEEEYDSVPSNHILENAVTNSGLENCAIDSRKKRNLFDAFSVDLTSHRITNQNKSGRCWIFAGLNILRDKCANKLNINDIEFSQSYLQFYDKLEKANFFLEKCIELSDESIFSRLNIFLLDQGISDGGHWAMFVNLVNKYGIVPSSSALENNVTSDTTEMNILLKKLLNKDCYLLRNEKNPSLRREMKEKILSEIYRILCICLGKPTDRAVFEFKDKDGIFHRIDTDPLSFYKEYIGEDLSSYVSLTDGLIEGYNPFTKYTCKYVNNMIGKDDVIFFDVGTTIMRNALVESLKGGSPVWFAAGVREDSLRKEGYLSSRIKDYESLFGIELLEGKGNKLTYRTNFCTHAMTFVGCNIVEGKVNRYKVENSWGKDNGKDGYYTMDDSWFEENVYQCIVERKYVDPETLKKYDESKVVEADPFTAMWA